MAERVMTGPIAVIKVGGIAIGSMKSIRCTETFRRQPVKGIGRLAPSEMPALDWNGTLNCGAYTIDLRKAVIPGSVQRIAQTVTEWENFLTLQEDGLQIDILRKKKVVTGSPLVLPSFEIFASIKGCFASREGWDITELQISGRDMDFDYITPILFPI